MVSGTIQFGMVHGDLHCVMNRLPSLSQATLSLFFRSEDFRCLCEEYRLARDALRRWEAVETPDGRARVAEYSLLAERIEVEIMRALLRDQASGK